MRGKFLILSMSMDGSGQVQEMLGCHPQINLVKLLSGVILDREYILVIQFSKMNTDRSLNKPYHSVLEMWVSKKKSDSYVH